MTAMRTLFVVLALLVGTNAFAAPVPNTAAEAFAELDKLLSQEDRNAFKSKSEDAAVTDTHFALGMYIRNQWFRAGGSKLVGELRGYGARSIDDMSAMILSAYWRHLNGEPYDLQRQGDCYRRWWAEQEKLVEAAKAASSSSYAVPSLTCTGA